MADGIGVRELCRLIDHAGAYLVDEYGLSLKRHIAFNRHVSQSSYWQRLQEHLQGRGHTAIIGLWGKYIPLHTSRNSLIYREQQVRKPLFSLARPHEKLHHSAARNLLIYMDSQTCV